MWQVSASTAQVLLPSTNEATSLAGNVEAIAGRHAGADEQLDAPEQLLVLELLVGEADDRLERGLVAEGVVAADLGHLGADEALDQAEHVGVGAALHLAEEARLAGLRKSSSLTSESPSGMNSCARSNSRPRRTSRSMSQRTRFGGFDRLRVAPAVDRRGESGLHGVTFREAPSR
jgi:hypothetical protein